MIAQPVNLGLFSPALAGRIYPLPVSIQGNPDLKEQSLDAFEIGYTGVVVEARRRCRRRSTSTAQERHPLHRRIDRWLHGRRTRRRAGRCRPAVIALVPGRQLPGALHLPELRQEHAEGFRARRQHPGEPDRRRVRELLLAGDAGPEGLRSQRAEPPAEEPLQRRRSTIARALPRRPSVSYSGSAFWQDVLDDRYHGTTSLHAGQRRLRRALGRRTRSRPR